ncbi:MAG: RNA polymerase sigma factor (sigma-70 family) [Parvicella sp.]|jgi:RNA polymerase sigma factor (sigma-70 family)
MEGNETTNIDHLSDKAKHDYSLVRRAVDNRDQKAFAELMERYKDSIYYMLLKMIRNGDDAEDLMIEAFGKAFNRLHQYTPNYAFSTWLFKIATNNCIDFIRKKKKNVLSLDNRYNNDDGDSLMIELKSEGLNPEQSAIRDQKLIIMRDVVNRLKPRYKLLIEMRYFQELSYDEIATEMDLPLGTVKAQLFRAREFLFNILHSTRESI